MAAFLVHDRVIGRDGASTKTWVEAESWDMSVLLDRREVRGLEKREGPEPCAVGNRHDLMMLVWEARRACIIKLLFMMFW